MANTETLLQAWRTEIVAEIETGEAELSAALGRLQQAELTEAATREHWHALNIHLGRCTRNNEPLAGALAMRLAAEDRTRQAAVGALTGARLQLANIERAVAERRGALSQLDRALAPPAAPIEATVPLPMPKVGDLKPLEIDEVIEFPRRRSVAATA